MTGSARPSARAFFVTGTDTGVGKTLIAAALLRGCRAQGLRVAGMKPVASGCMTTPAGLRNEDALTLLRESSAQWPYEVVNPCAYRPAIAPHLAAEEAGRPVDFEAIAANYATLTALSDIVIVEGAGGWRTPLGGALTVGHLARHLELPVIIVVRLRLGCLNHALLTAESVLAQGASIGGWVANGIESDFERRAENVATLKGLIPAPCLATIPRLEPPDVAAAAARLDIRTLLA
ncbi:MAG TPA: dethiobiotin synthase [Steroidobacteraceae bacterium]|nr:dethiobiotin synthase [Steroidobacteraceae bacterium]